LEQAVDIRLDLRNSLHPLGEHAKLLERMREAEVFAESLDDRRRLGQVSAYLSGYFVQEGNDPVQAIENGQRALAIASAIGDFSLQIQANHFVASTHYKLGDYDRAIKHFTTNADSLAGDQVFERFGLVFLASVGSRYQLVLLHSDRGEFNQASIHADEVVRISEAAHQPYTLFTAYYAVGCLHLRRGGIDKAIGVLEHGVEVGRRWSIHDNSHRLAAALGTAYAAAGRLGDALPLLDWPNERRPSGLVQLAQGYLLAGKLDQAFSLANRAVDASRRDGQRGHEAGALYVLGETAQNGTPPDYPKAEDYYDQAISLAGELKMRPLLAHCQAGLGKLYQHTGNHEKAKTHLTTAVAICVRWKWDYGWIRRRRS
jgi:tetratricopeptide (TPR) repeat protein